MASTAKQSSPSVVVTAATWSWPTVAAAPVNYLKLMPATYVVLVLVVGYMLLTVTADVVNPIRLFR